MLTLSVQGGIHSVSAWWGGGLSQQERQQRRPSLGSDLYLRAHFDVSSLNAIPSEWRCHR